MEDLNEEKGRVRIMNGINEKAKKCVRRKEKFIVRERIMVPKESEDSCLGGMENNRRYDGKWWFSL